MVVGGLSAGVAHLVMWLIGDQHGVAAKALLVLLAPVLRARHQGAVDAADAAKGTRVHRTACPP